MFLLEKIPTQNLCFFNFCIFVLLDMVRVHAKAGPWARPHAAYLIRPFERTFFTLPKKPLLSDFTYLGLKQARPKNPSKKSVIFLERGPGGEPLPAAWALKIDGF